MKYNVLVDMGVVEADNESDARQQALDLLENYAGSNDGSEILANADPILQEVK